MKYQYRLSWFDKLIRLHTRDHNNKSESIVDTDINALKTRLKQQTVIAQLQITDHVFQQAGRQQISILVQEYHHSIVSLMNLISQLRDSQEILNQHIDMAYDLVTESLMAIFNYVESRFDRYLGNARQIPLSIFLSFKEDINNKLQKVSADLIAGGYPEELIGLVSEEINSFMARNPNSRYISEEQTQYISQLINSLADLAKNKTSTLTLDEVLISMNFNSSEYTENFIRRLKRYTGQLSSHGEKILCIQSRLSDIGCIISRPEHALFPERPTVKASVMQCLQNELEYLEKLSAYYSSSAAKETAEQQIKGLKVVMGITGDQIAIIIRAACDSGLFIGKSLRSIFQRFIPYLSTSEKRDLSADGIRSKSYDPETRDKEIVIKWLQKLIATIKEY